MCSHRDLSGDQINLKESVIVESKDSNNDDPKNVSAFEARRKNLITIKDHKDKFIKIMTHTLYKEKCESLTLIMHVKNAEYYFFLFVIKNTKEEHQVKQSFIFLRKTIAEMKNIFHNNLWTPLIGDLEEVPLLKNSLKLEMQYFEGIQDHQFSFEHNPIKLSVFSLIDESFDHNCVPMIY